MSFFIVHPVQQKRFAILQSNLKQRCKASHTCFNWQFGSRKVNVQISVVLLLGYHNLFENGTLVGDRFMRLSHSLSASANVLPDRSVRVLLCV